MAAKLRFRDVDFRRWTSRLRGDISSGPLEGVAFREAIPLIPRDEWYDRIREIEENRTGAENLLVRIYDQGNEGTCTSNAICQACEYLQALQFGRERVVRLSPISLYKRVARSARSGSAVSDNLEELAARGVLPLAGQGYAHEMPHTGFSTPMPPGWQNTARQFRGLEWWVVHSAEELISALLLGFCVVGGRQGHAICYVRPVIHGNDIVVAYANSWGRWGAPLGDWSYGFGFDSREYFSRAAQWAVALRSFMVPEEVWLKK